MLLHGVTEIKGGKGCFMKIRALAKAVGKSVPYVTTVIKRYGLVSNGGFSDGHVVLIKKITALAICGVPAKDIEQLLARERKLLELMRVDSLHPGADWFEALCVMRSGATRLLLSGYDIGTDVTAKIIQPGLDFIERDQELFKSHEMGSDVLCALDYYLQSYKRITERLRGEMPVIESAIKWSHEVLAQG